MAFLAGELLGGCVGFVAAALCFAGSDKRE